MKRPLHPIAIVVAVASFALASYGMQQLLSWWRREPAVPASVVQKPWVEQHLGRNLVFEAPWQLHPEAVELPAEVKPLVRSSTWLTKEADGLAINATALLYREDIPVDLDGAADGAIANIKMVPGTLSVEPTKTETTMLGGRAIALDARIRRNGAEPLRLRGVVFIAGGELFIFLLIARDDQPSAASAWDRMRSSIHSGVPAR